MTAPSELVTARFQQALALHQQGQLGSAEALYKEILQAQPRHGEALHMLGIAAGQRGDGQAAVALLDQAIAINPNQAATYADRGIALHSLRRLEDALASFDQALALQPDYPVALRCRGVVLQALKRPEEALASFDRALALQPGRADALYGRGLALQTLRRPDDAVASYDQALTLQPDHAQALHDRGLALRDLQRMDESVASFERALALRPDYPELFGTWLHTRMMACDWTGLDAAYARLAEGIDAGQRLSPPFVLTATPLPLQARRRCAELYVRQKYPPVAVSPGRGLRAPHNRLRLGYFSADFRRHAVAYLTAGMFESHDRNRFELIAFAFGPPATGPVRARIRAAFDQFIDVDGRSDADVARLAKEMEIDIAVDLMGFTTNSRTGIFARRAAPLQVSFLGYTGTMGADYMDYLIADTTVIPREDVRHYAEKIAYLPDTYWPFDARLGVAERQFTRQDVGLPEQGFVFCCFNNNWKITPEVFDIWMRLLARVEGSVLWLLEDNPAAGRNLRTEAGKRGIAAERLVFAPRMNLPEHLARQRLADLFVDTLPYNAHTTASDALWIGLPVLTRSGETFPGRVAASLLKAVGLPELITASPEGYEALALELATDAPRLAALRQRLAGNRLTHPLFNTALFTRHIEAAYTAMWQRHQSGLPPDHIVV